MATDADAAAGAAAAEALAGGGGGVEEGGGAAEVGAPLGGGGAFDLTSPKNGELSQGPLTAAAAGVAADVPAPLGVC